MSLRGRFVSDERSKNMICPNCKIPMLEHPNNSKLQWKCHWCGYGEEFFSRELILVLRVRLQHKYVYGWDGFDLLLYEDQKTQTKEGKTKHDYKEVTYKDAFLSELSNEQIAELLNIPDMLNKKNTYIKEINELDREVCI